MCVSPGLAKPFSLASDELDVEIKGGSRWGSVNSNAKLEPRERADI